MFTHHRTEGVILDIKHRGEGDELFILFTKDFGKVEVLGRSIRKGRSKLRMNMSLFSHVEISFIEGKVFNTLTDVSLVCNFKSAKNTLSKLSIFYRISEITLLLVRGEVKDERIFNLFLDSFYKTDKENLSKDSLKLLFCFFSFKLLYFLGYKLYTKKCVFCSLEIKRDCYLNLKEGGLVCSDCFRIDPFGMHLDNKEVLISFFKKNIDEDFNEDSTFFLKVLTNYLSFIPETKGKRVP